MNRLRRRFQHQRVRGRPAGTARLAVGPGFVRVAVVGRQRMAALAARHVQVAFAFVPWRDRHPLRRAHRGAWMRGMFSESPGSGWAGMSSQAPAPGTARLSGCWMRVVL